MTACPRSWLPRGALGLCLVCALGVPTAEAAPEPKGRDEGPSYHYLVTQGRFFLGHGQVREAVEALQAAAATGDGRKDPAVYELLARGGLQLGDPGLAVQSVRTAISIAGEGAGPELKALAELLDGAFGKVLVIGAGMEGAWTPEPATPILDPEWKRIYLLSIGRLGEVHGGSTSLWLPVGSYRVGDQVVLVEAGVVSRMDLRREVGQRGGVWGEQRRPSGLAPAAPGSVGLRVSIGGAALVQQGTGTVAARGILGPLVVAGEGSWRALFHPSVLLELLRVERIQGAVAPPGVSIGGGIVGGADRALSADWQLGPRLGFWVSWAHPADPALPVGYLGPLNYLVFGPDLGLELRRPLPDGPDVSLGFRACFREYRPLDPPPGQDLRPHLGGGGGFDLGFTWGGS